MPSLIQRFVRARKSGDDLPPGPRPKTSAEELTTPTDVVPGPPSSHDARVGGDSSKNAEDPKDGVDRGAAESEAPGGRRTTETHLDEVKVGDDGAAADTEQQQEVDPIAAAAAAAELKKASKKAKAAAALKRMKARSSFSVWTWLPTFYDPVEDTIRSRIIAVLAVAVIPAMLTGLLLEPMITDVSIVTRDKVVNFAPLFIPMDPMYVGVFPAKGYEFRFVVRNSKNWPQSGKSTRYKPPDQLQIKTLNPSHSSPRLQV